MEIDALIAISIFLIFAVGFAGIYLQNLNVEQRQAKILALQKEASQLLNSLLSTPGFPEDWEKKDVLPAEPGIISYVKRIPIVIREDAGIDRFNEPIELSLSLDDDCKLKAWNGTVRAYDDELREVPIKLIDIIYCNPGWIKEVNISLEINISNYSSKRVFIYYYNDTSIEFNAKTFSYNTSSWLPRDGDSFTESLTNWYGINSQLTLANGKVGSNAINASGNNNFGAEYNEASQIMIGNRTWLRFWVYIKNASITSFNVSLSDGNAIISKNIASKLVSNDWVLFEEELNASWLGWQNFNINNGIDYVRFEVKGQGSNYFMIDGMRFELKPLLVKVFSEEEVKVISAQKLEKLKNLDPEMLKSLLGEELGIIIKIR